MFTVRVDIKQKSVMTVFSGGSVGVTVLLHGSGLLSGDSLPADPRHVQYLTMVMLRSTVLYIYSHQLTEVGA